MVGETVPRVPLEASLPCFYRGCLAELCGIFPALEADYDVFALPFSADIGDARYTFVYLVLLGLLLAA